MLAAAAGVFLAVLFLGGPRRRDRPPPGFLAGRPSTSPATRPGADERRRDRARMVRELLRHQPEVTDQRVLTAMLAVPRHRFVPPRYQGSAYDDTPLPIGCGQTISQPYIVALMSQLLEVKPGDRVLEVGTGSGYPAAVLAEMGCEVYTIEIFEELARSAADRLRDLGYHKVTVKAGDGYPGWKEHAPFDAVVVTCAANHIPPALIGQLKPGGRMCIPLGPPFSVQDLVVVTKRADETVRSRSIIPVRFVPMRRGPDRKPAGAEE